MTKIELEIALENRCVAKVEAAGGLALKLSIPGVRGFPDRTMLLPGTPPLPVKLSPGEWVEVNVRNTPRVWFAEIKRLKSGKVSAQQHRWRVLLHQLGFGFYLIDTDEQFDEAMAKESRR